MIRKLLLCPQQRRRVPKQFSWIDQRFLRHGYFRRCSKDAVVLYFFLLIVADAEGLSYYADHTIAQRLNLDPTALNKARSELLRCRLIAYEPPLYQVLELVPPDDLAFLHPSSTPSRQRDSPSPGASSPKHPFAAHQPVSLPAAKRGTPPQPLGTILSQLLNPKPGP